jgi:hypothetical protein
MNRRQFLKRALCAAPLIVAPAGLAELLAPSRTIFLPPRGGWLGPYTELAEITRKAFVPQLVVQVYKTSPLMVALMRPHLAVHGVPVVWDDPGEFERLALLEPA